MSILLLMIPIALGLSFFFMWAFAWATRSGQWDDLELASLRILKEDRQKEGEKNEPRS